MSFDCTSSFKGFSHQQKDQGVFAKLSSEALPEEEQGAVSEAPPDEEQGAVSEAPPEEEHIAVSEEPQMEEQSAVSEAPQMEEQSVVSEPTSTEEARAETDLVTTTTQSEPEPATMQDCEDVDEPEALPAPSLLVRGSSQIFDIAEEDQPTAEEQKETGVSIEPGSDSDTVVVSPQPSDSDPQQKAVLQTDDEIDAFYQSLTQ